MYQVNLLINKCQLTPSFINLVFKLSSHTKHKFMNNATKLVLTLLISSLVFGCNMTGANQDKNLRLIEKYVQAVENLDYETMASCLAEDYIGIGPSHNDSIKAI